MISYQLVQWTSIHLIEAYPKNLQLLPEQEQPSNHSKSYDDKTNENTTRIEQIDEDEPPLLETRRKTQQR